MGRDHPGANGGVGAIFCEGSLAGLAQGVVAAAVGRGRSRARRVVIERGIDVNLMTGTRGDAAERDATN
jgi:hypothetical protein